MRSTPFGVPGWVERLLLGHHSSAQRKAWMAVLLALLLCVPITDYALGRNPFHLNFYPLPVVLSIFLFGQVGLSSVLVLLALYHLVQVQLGVEAQTVMVNNLGQLGLTFVVGMVCSWLVSAYRALYREKAKLAVDRHELLLNLTHELRSPLFAIGGIVRNLQRNIGRIPETSIREQLNEAQAAIASINRDVDGLVQVFRSDLQELEPQFSAVEAADLIEAVKRRYPPEHTPAHQLQWTVPTGLEKLRCDPLLTQQILDNLVSNALRHTPGGAVRVTVARWGDEIRLRVEDEGPGIPVEDRQRIFDRHDTGTRPKASGFGVGLYLVKIYTKVQGGRVEVDDVPAGASFSIYLPIQE